MDAARTLILLAATITTGLLAGLYYAFSIAVMPGLARGDARTLITTMQNINTAIGNGWFMLSFIGAPVLAIVTIVLHVGRPSLPWVIAAVVLIAASVIITAALNIPLNQFLAAAGDPDRIADLQAVRERFEAPWVRWNVLRAVTTTVALGCLVWALVIYGRASAAA